MIWPLVVALVGAQALTTGLKVLAKLAVTNKFSSFALARHITNYKAFNFLPNPHNRLPILSRSLIRTRCGRVAKSLLRFVLCTEADPQKSLKKFQPIEKCGRISLCESCGGPFWEWICLQSAMSQSPNPAIVNQKFVGICRFSKLALKLNSNQNTINLHA